MSRIGKLPVPVPSAVDVKIADGRISVTGPKGTLERALPAGAVLEQTKEEITVKPVDGSRTSRAAWGLVRSLVSNMVLGVSVGYERSLMIQGTGYRCEPRKIGKSKWLQFALGYSHPILMEVPEGIEAAVDPKANRISLKCADKELLGLTAAKIRSFRPPEPYKGKGIRYENEHVRRKVGKAGTR
jgi:large subunit ribosomal protein L6